MFGRPKGMVVVGLITLSGISWGIKMTVPYAIVGKCYPGEGICTAVLNCSLCVSNIAVAIFTPFIVAMGGGRTSLAFYLSGFCALGAFFMCLALDDGGPDAEANAALRQAAAKEAARAEEKEKRLARVESGGK